MTEENNTNTIPEQSGQPAAGSEAPEAEDIIAKAHANAEDERNAIYAAAAASIADLSVSVASKIVGETLDQDGEQRRLIERYVKEAGSLNA